MNLKDKISESTERVLKIYKTRLERLGIVTFEDFLFHIPFRYEDYSLVSKISEVQPGETVTVQGQVLEIKTEYTRYGKRIQKAKISDNSGIIDAIWFNQPYLVRAIPQNSFVSLSGKVDQNGNKLTIQSPEFELLDDSGTIHTGRLVPVYPETQGVSSKWFRRQVHKLLNQHKDELIEYLPYPILKNNNFLEFREAIEQIHFPKTLDHTNKARLRLSFDELFLLHLASKIRKNQWNQQLCGYAFSIAKHKEKLKQFIYNLPFELTNGQKQAVDEILADLSKDKPMNRLLEGDVGSGKTVVATIVMYITFLNGYQSALMAPTEILAHQHYQAISSLLSPFGVRVEPRTGSNKRQAERVKGKIDVLIGTHALLSEKVKFNNLGFVVIDEQQRFGVEQRSIMRLKGKNPHLLTMTATPIPRTVALTIYGDLDLSYLNELPKGRKQIKTWLVPKEKRQAAYEWIKKELKQTDSQAFIICPFIEESESMTTVKAAKKEFEYLKKDIFSSLRLGLLHGKQKEKEKDLTLHDFGNKKIDILVATPIVEVGIDFPNATIILVEASERFGLAGLHQLRGRVGRGKKQSYCLLFTESESELTKKRLKSMETIQNGSKLAELDLKIRGAGDVYGTLQHGKRQLKIASFSDATLVSLVHQEAKTIFPNLSNYPKLLEKLKNITFKQVSPD